MILIRSSFPVSKPQPHPKHIFQLHPVQYPNQYFSQCLIRRKNKLQRLLETSQGKRLDQTRCCKCYNFTHPA